MSVAGERLAPDRRTHPRPGAHRVPAFWAALSATAALRLIFAWSFIAHHAERALALAPFSFESSNVAYALATGQGFSSPLRVPSGPTAWVAPVYPTLLAGVFRIFGPDSFGAFVAAVGLNILFATLVCLPLYAAARALAGHRAGLIACCIWAVYPNAILLTYQSMWNGCLSALLGVTLVWATLRLRAADPRRANAVPWILFGLLWGLTLLTNPVFAAVLPVLFFLAARQWRTAVLGLAAAALCVLPWTLRNRATLHAWVPVRSDLGLALWLGNNAGASVPWHGQQHPLDDAGQRALFLRQGEIPYMRAKFRAAVEYMAAHSRRTAERAWLRFWAFWSGGAPRPWRVLARGQWQRRRLSGMDRYVLLADLLSGLGALAGWLWLWHRRRPGVWIVAAFPLLIPCAYYLTEAIPRYRLAIDPEVILLAASCVTFLWRPAPRQESA